MIDDPLFADTVYIVDPIPEKRGRPRTYHPDKPSTSLERSQKHKAFVRKDRERRIAVLDMETDPFDAERQEEIIRPFAACLYSDQFPQITIWEENYELFVQRLLDALGEIEERYGAFTIYAHNGGKFDYMFLVHKLRGKVSFKGRGIMSARIGNHELRDSFHIIPEKLAAYRKEAFDYKKMTKALRNQHKEEILTYLQSDCVYLFDIVRDFVNKFGLKISIGQAAMYHLQKHYKTGRIGENTDAHLRQWFFGGRVECLAGKGHFVGDYNLYDVNSMYPYVMSNCSHPISKNYTIRRKGGINEKTCFVEVECKNFGALVRRADNNETTATEDSGTFLTTIWEFETALELGMITDVTVKGYIDNDTRTNFAKFVEPLYASRLDTKARLDELKKTGFSTASREYTETKKDDIFYKLLLNNAYGKFAQNPRRFKETWLSAPDERPDDPAWASVILPHFQCADYWIWQKPADKFRFNNVGTAASITGAARAVLLRAIHGALDPIYCDTDSLICRRIDGVEIHKTKLGAWDLEAEYSEVIICGKKLYACKPREWDGQEASLKVRSKGSSGVTWSDMLALLRGESVEKINPAPTFNKFGRQFYISREIRATAPTATRRYGIGSRTYA